MDLGKDNDFTINEADLFKEKTVRRHATPKDIVLNLLSALLIYVVLIICNLFINGNADMEFNYTQLFSWKIGILVIINWVGGIAVVFCTRQSGISKAKMTEKYKNAEEGKDKAFAKITDFAEAQRKLNELTEAEFLERRNDMARTIAVLVKEKMPSGQEWQIGDKLPKGTHVNVKILKMRLERLTPSKISLVALAQSELSYKYKGPYDIPAPPDQTGAGWFLRRAGGKLGWFAIGPIVLSMFSSMLVFGFNISNIFTVLGTLAIMLFNAARSYATAYYSVLNRGVARFKQIERIVNDLTK